MDPSLLHWNLWFMRKTLIEREEDRGSFVPPQIKSLQKSEFFKHYNTQQQQQDKNQNVLSLLTFAIPMEYPEQLKASYKVPNLPTMEEVSEHVGMETHMPEGTIKANFAVTSGSYDLSLNLIIRPKIQLYSGKTYEGLFSTERLFLFVITQKRIDIHLMQEIELYRQFVQAGACTVIAHNYSKPDKALNDYARTLLKQLQSQGKNIEFNELIRSHNVTKCQGTHQYYRLSDKEIEQWKKENPTMQIDKMAIKKKKDRVSQYYNYQEGDFIRVQLNNGYKRHIVIESER